MDLGDEKEFYNVGKIGGVNFIVAKNKNDEIIEKMMTDDEIKESSITFSNYDDCSDEIKNYLEGL
jgi:hypothetical protein